ncbi:MAG: acetate kinase [Anaeroplasmataceae bacterium]
MKVMAINAGSSSIKFQLLEMPSEAVIASGIMERIGLEEGIFTIKYDGKKDESTPVLENHKVGVELLLKTLIEKNILESLNEIAAIGHRVVQGGEEFKDSTLITKEVIKKIEDLSDLAPLHNPAHIVGINAFEAVLPNVKQVAVFDTVFHQTMSPDAYLYALPYEWYKNYGVRKYGFHGTSHQYVSYKTADIMKKDVKDLKIIVCHLGNGASISAVKNGKCVDTSMGLTPLEGIPMGTRSGNIDPTIFDLLKTKEGLNTEQILNILNKKSGYLGVSGISSDARDVLAGMDANNDRCKLAFDIQAKRICDYIGSYYISMGGLDAIAFTAGMGENVIYLRQLIAERLSVLGVEIDKEKNNVRGEEREISSKNSKVKLFVVPTNEEVVIARDTVRVAKI